MTIGKANCNPLNIRYTPVNRWLGQTGCNKGFCTFSSMDYGFRAAIVLLRNYVRRGLDTPRKIISNWAPPSENDTESYIKNCPFPWDSNYRLTTLQDICILCAGMAYIESRVEVVPLDLVDLAIKFNIKF